MKIVCCLCGKIKSKEGWVSRIATAQNKKNMSHGFCPGCYEKTVKKINLARARTYDRNANLC